MVITAAFKGMLLLNPFFNQKKKEEEIKTGRLLRVEAITFSSKITAAAKVL